MNTFGVILKLTTWGESHGPAIGGILDGFPSGFVFDLEKIQYGLSLRAPGKNSWTTPRKESDTLEILSGVFRGKTTGAPISFYIPNTNVQSEDYDLKEHLVRPGHAQQTYKAKYKHFDHRGGGRASARETAVRVAAGLLISQWMEETWGIFQTSYLLSVGPHLIDPKTLGNDPKIISLKRNSDPLYCPDPKASQVMQNYLLEILNSGDSAGGSVGFLATGLPPGLGSPLYDKLSARLAYAMMSIPATRGFEFGDSSAHTFCGSQYNDSPTDPLSNHSGGLLGGLTTGQPLFGRVFFKPTSSIQIPSKTMDLRSGQEVETIPTPGKRHDPCVAIRGTIVVESMMSLCLGDALLSQGKQARKTINAIKAITDCS